MNRKLDEKHFGNLIAEEMQKVKGNILNACAKSPALKSHSPLNNYRIIFTSYNHGESELHNLNKQLCKKLINRLVEVTSMSGETILSSNWKSPSIKNDPKYRNLYSTIPPDTNLYHKDLGKKARLFYFVVANFFCIVSVNKLHK